MSRRHELIVLPAAQLLAGDLVLLSDGHRAVAEISAPAGAERVWIQWTDGSDSIWLAAERCEVVRQA